MNIELAVNAAQAISILKQLLEGDDLLLRQGHNFNYFNSIVSGADKYVTEHFSPRWNTIVRAQGFWIMLTDRDGRPVATVAARIEQLAHGETVAEYLKGYLPRVYFAEGGLPVELDDRQPSFCEEASGKVVYLGEAWADAKYRRRGLAGNMVKLIQLLALVMYEPDFLYCWIRPRHATTGFPQACGYKEIFSRAIWWRRPPALPEGDPDKDLHDLWLAGNRRGGLEDLAGDVLAEHGSPSHKEGPA